MENLNIKKITGIALTVILLIVAISFSGRLAEQVEAGETVVIQHPLSGTFDVYTTPGTYFQYLGKATHYKKRTTLYFDKEHGAPIKIRFNDGGHADVYCSISMDFPTSRDKVLACHTKFGSQEALEKDLITTVMQKSVYMTGPLMSSKESYAEKRNDLIAYIEDQSMYGVYKTSQKDVKQIDQLTQGEKLVTIVEIKKDTVSGEYLRQEKSLISEFGIKLSNLSIKTLDYDPIVEKQIKTQQELTMQVQTAIANAKKSEQDALTAEQSGKAKATEAKWEQEVIKAKNTTEAEAKRLVAETEVKTAALNKERDILAGQGRAEVKRLDQASNGSLNLKLDAWVQVNKAYADAIKGSQWVPTYYNGAGGAGGKGGTFDPTGITSILMMKTAQELKLNPNAEK